RGRPRRPPVSRYSPRHADRLPLAATGPARRVNWLALSLLRRVGFDLAEPVQVGLLVRAGPRAAPQPVVVVRRVDLLDGHRLAVALPPHLVARLVLPAPVRLAHASPHGAGWASGR